MAVVYADTVSGQTTTHVTLSFKYDFRETTSHNLYHINMYLINLHIMPRKEQKQTKIINTQQFSIRFLANILFERKNSFLLRFVTIFIQHKLQRWAVGMFFFPELGTQQFRRDNVTMLSSHKVVCNSILLYLLLLPHLDTEA